MQGHVYSLSEVVLDLPSIVSIGMFDGVHLGHQKLVGRLVEESRRTGRTSVVLTFYPHPDIVLKGVTGRYYLTSPEERAGLLLDMGVDLVVTHPFDEDVRRIRAADFVDSMVAHLNLSALWVGADFALGYKREGDVAYLRQQGSSKGFSVETVDLKSGGAGKVISSSRIRGVLPEGDVEAAAELLGRPYSLSGEVVHGDHRGRTIGFPTANIAVWEERALPGNGVYACWAYVGDARHMAVTNVGVRPTFNGDQLMVEAHLLDYAGDLYGQAVRLDFVAQLRPEQRFKGVEQLVAQIHQDAAGARKILTALAERE